ncbi:GroES-like protein [Choiromyces venosus 120613-1]|uniref:alcohol dehydrogenase (NADP(+)) n=1 Tax=Choiromyces venosus 120613-1 TaxID=1336337 RepID=A0A3N4JGV7_9PEZI|nr:GroES-like protein [Choiromyces venosus 120613-1]
MSTHYSFKGWVGLSKDCVEKQNLVYMDIEPKTFTEDDVDIRITHCGICGSDVHTLTNGWGDTRYPTVAGHEIVGTAVKVGKNVQGIKVGDRVGCKDDNENYCNGMVRTYNGKYPDGSKSSGGYADYTRVPSHFVFKIPDELPSEIAAPMLCGGITVFSPLKRNGCGPGKTVGIIGIGGLGHFGVLFAKALGADKIIAISRKSNKADDALAMGADAYVATDDDPNWASKHANTLDLIVCTVNSPKLPIDSHLQLLRHHGTFVQVGAPEDSAPGFNMFPLILKRVKITGSFIGSPREIEEMLELAARKGVRSWVNPWPLEKVNDALQAFERGEPRYRIVLVNEKYVGK